MSSELLPMAQLDLQDDEGSRVSDRNPVTVAFNNNRSVQNQVNQQIIHGNLTFVRGRGPKIRPFQIDETATARAKESLDDDRKASVESPYGETCQWILDRSEFKAWRRASSGLLWIKGKPGAGKSTLMAHMYRIIPHDLDNAIHLDFFFSARGVQLQRTFFGMLRSLLCQLFQQHHGIRDLLRRSYQEKCAAFGKQRATNSRPSWTWQRPELESILTDTILATSNTRQVIIFVDALDEAGEQGARQIARYFHTINDRITQDKLKARICISCRHYPILSTIQGTEIHVEHHNHSDIAMYIDNYISHNNLQQSSKWDGLKSDLVRQASGIFQWACLIAPIVEGYIMDGDSPDEIRKWLNQVPKALESVYLYILENVIDQRNIRKSFELFRWVCLAQRPLSVLELRYALATHDLSHQSRTRCDETNAFIKDNETMKKRIKSWSGGLMEVVQGDGNDAAIVRVIHQSVNDFSLSQGLKFLATQSATERDTASTDPPTLTDFASTGYHHHHLYWSCLKYLFSEKGGNYSQSYYNQYHRPVHHTRNMSSEDWIRCYNNHSFDEAEFSNRQQDNRQQDNRYKVWLCGGYPLLEYAAINMLTHGSKAGSYRCQNVAEEAQLLNEMMHYWTHATTLFKQMDSSYLERGATLLHAAAEGGFEDLVIHLLENGAAVDANDSRERTPLHVAGFGGRLAIAKRLLDGGADTQRLDHQSKTALMIACENGHSELFSLLMNQDTRLRLLTEYSYDVQFTAARQGNIRIIKILLQAGINDRSSRAVYGTVLEAASEQGHEKVVRLLVEADSDAGLCSQAADYGTAIVAAASAGHDEVVRVLAEAGGDVNALSVTYGTALQAASYRGHERVVQLLIQAGADPNLRGGLWDNALHAALYTTSCGTSRESIVGSLIDAGANVNLEGGFFGCAIVAASFNGYEEVVRLLIKAGANVNAQVKRFGSALQAASGNGHIDIVRLLIDAGADVNLQGGSRPAAFQAASLNARKAIMQLLIEAGADTTLSNG